MNVVFWAVFLFFLEAGKVWAFQEHPSPEGLIAHELAHLFYAGAMILFAYRLKVTGLSQRPHWNYIRWAAFLLVFWNIWAFIGHLLEVITTPHIVPVPKPGEIIHYCQRKLVISSIKDLAYFIFKNDNIFALIAFYLIFLGVNRMERILKEGRR